MRQLKIELSHGCLERIAEVADDVAEPITPGIFGRFASLVPGTVRPAAARGQTEAGIGSSECLRHQPASGCGGFDVVAYRTLRQARCCR